MRIVVAAVGRMKQGPERDLAERFRKRAAASGRNAGLQDFDIIEIKESRAGDAQRRMLEESIAVANIIPEKAVTVILDGRGEDMTSASFAGRLQGWRSEDRPAVACDVAAPGKETVDLFDDLEGGCEKDHMDPFRSAPDGKDVTGLGRKHEMDRGLFIF